jgi:hypothetical protein
MDRVEINGFWYVKEDTISKEEKIELNPMYSEEITVESNDFVFTATKLFGDDTVTQLGDIDIKFTDKRVKPWKEEYWDNILFIKGVLNKDTESLGHLSNFSSDDIKYLQAFLKYLRDKDWL